MVVVDALHRDSAAAAADELFGGGIDYADLLAFLDRTAPEEKASGCGNDDEEELEWLSNKDAFPTVETMDSALAGPRTKGVRQAVVAAEGRQCRHCGTESTPQWREGPMGRGTLCNACGLKYRAGLLLPEYRPANSPTFSSELHSNRKHRIVELRRLKGEPVQTSIAAAGAMTPAGQRPRTKGLQRPRSVVAWSPPPPPQTPAQGRVSGGCADGARAEAPAGGGVEDTAPRGLAVAGPRRGLGGRDGMAVDQGRVPGGDAAADQGRAVGQLLNQPGLGVPFVGDSCMAGDKGPAAAAAAPSGGGMNHAARAAATALPAVAQRWCQHCGTETTTQWRKGPDGRPKLCTACVKRYKGGGLVPEYRPATASCPTFSSTLHSSSPRIVQRQRASTVVTTATAAATIDAGDK